MTAVHNPAPFLTFSMQLISCNIQNMNITVFSHCTIPHGNLHSYMNLLHVLYLRKCSIYEVLMFSDNWHGLWCQYKPAAPLCSVISRYNKTHTFIAQYPAFSNVHFILTTSYYGHSWQISGRMYVACSGCNSRVQYQSQWRSQLFNPSSSKRL